MSGGCFDNSQFKLISIAEELDEYIQNNNSNIIDEYGDKIYPNYSSDIIEKFKQTRDTLELLYDRIHAIDYLICGDYGEECFNKKWTEINENN